MAMNYSTLIASKTTQGSIANWVNYARLDIDSILTEAQALIYQNLRVREMESIWPFRMGAGDCSIAIPDDFLDQNGPLRSPSHMLEMYGSTKSRVEGDRTYEEVDQVSLGVDPFATTLNSKLVSVTLVGHDMTGGSLVTISNSVAVGGLTLNGTYQVISLTSDDVFVIQADAAATSTAVGGGSSAVFTATRLAESFPSSWAVYDGRLQFDVAFEEAMRFRMPCYRRPAYLSEANPTNFLTDRYPNLLRKACMAAAADFNEDTEEYNKHMADLGRLIMGIAAQDDLRHRATDIMTDNP